MFTHAWRPVKICLKRGVANLELTRMSNKSHNKAICIAIRSTLRYVEAASTLNSWHQHTQVEFVNFAYVCGEYLHIYICIYSGSMNKFIYTYTHMIHIFIYTHTFARLSQALLSARQKSASYHMKHLLVLTAFKHVCVYIHIYIPVYIHMVDVCSALSAQVPCGKSHENKPLMHLKICCKLLAGLLICNL